jgi:hypothetical protein
VSSRFTCSQVSFAAIKTKRLKNTPGARFANSLIIATLLLIFTMVLHPMGGSIEYIQKISTVIMTTHALAILSVPFWILGFWGLTKQLEDDSLMALAAFIIMSVGMFAVLLAASVNGLVLPLFVNRYQNATPETISAIKLIVVYNTSLNKAFDLIYTGASCLAILLWSIAILKTRRLPVWLGWSGILLFLIAVVPIKTGFFFADLTGFRIFVSGFAIWTILIIISLRNIR